MVRKLSIIGGTPLTSVIKIARLKFLNVIDIDILIVINLQ